MFPLDDSHDPSARSWVATANAEETDFPLQNLPFCAFRPAAGGAQRLGIGIGDSILDLDAAAACGLLDGLAAPLIAACRQPVLNDLLALGGGHWRALRHRLFGVLGDGPLGEAARAMAGSVLVSQGQIRFALPMHIGDYSDYAASYDHLIRAPRAFGSDAPPPPNMEFVPLGYHGRASSIVVSGTAFRRPCGQAVAERGQPPVYGPSRALDFELEMGIVIGPGNALGSPLSLDEAEDTIFGLCLLNDWSARDIQAWESRPLGPFLGKSFATSIGPWIVTSSALRPFRMARNPRREGLADPLPYMNSERDRAAGGIDFSLSVAFDTARMRDAHTGPATVATTNFGYMYWSAAQLVAHHACNGCDLNPGDVVGSGTVSGPDPAEAACLLELTENGRKPLTLPNGETRGYVEDNDDVVLAGRATRDGFRSVGFGQCTGRVLSAIPQVKR